MGEARAPGLAKRELRRRHHGAFGGGGAGLRRDGGQPDEGDRAEADLWAGARIADDALGRGARGGGPRARDRGAGGEAGADDVHPARARLQGHGGALQAADEEGLRRGAQAAGGRARGGEAQVPHHDEADAPRPRARDGHGAGGRREDGGAAHRGAFGDAGGRHARRRGRRPDRAPAPPRDGADVPGAVRRSGAHGQPRGGLRLGVGGRGLRARRAL